MKVESRFRMTVAENCPTCLHCSLATAINRQYPQGFSAMDALAIASMLVSIAQAVLRASGAGTGVIQAGPMDADDAVRLVSRQSTLQ